MIKFKTQTYFEILPSTGSPFSLDVEDATHVVARGRSLEATPLNKRALFEVDASNAPFRANLSVKVFGESTYPFKRLIIIL